MIDFKALETFVWVARQQSFRATAERLHTTQPAISQRIAALEAELGVALLHRTTRKVALTAKGREVLEHAERLLAARSELVATVGDPTIRAGTLRLGVAETIVHTWLPRLIERTAQDFPRLTLEIEVDTSPNLSARLSDRELDLAVMVGPVTEPTFRTRPLCGYPVGFVASRHLDLPERPITPAEIADLPIVTFARNTRPYADLIEMLAKAGLRPRRLHASASVATIIKMAIDGLGIAVIPPIIVAEELARGRLREVATSAHVPDLHFEAAWIDSPELDLVPRVVDIAATVAREGRPSRRTRQSEKSYKARS